MAINIICKCPNCMVFGQECSSEVAVMSKSRFRKNKSLVFFKTPISPNCSSGNFLSISVTFCRFACSGGVWEDGGDGGGR